MTKQLRCNYLQKIQNSSHCKYILNSLKTSICTKASEIANPFQCCVTGHSTSALHPPKQQCLFAQQLELQSTTEDAASQVGL